MVNRVDNMLAASAYLEARNMPSYRQYLVIETTSGHPLYKLWEGVKNRCYNVNSGAYDNYGGRGIVMCELWRTNSKAFIDDIQRLLGPRPSSSHSLDRINNDGPYEPGNVRWATALE